MTPPTSGAIDVHTHIFPSGWDDFAARHGGDRWPRLVGDPAGTCKLYLGQTFNRNLGPNSFDPVRRIEDMDRTGIALQLLSPAPPTFCYWADGPAAAEWCRMQNDAIAAIVARHPDRFLGAGGLPLQAPDLAIKELERVATSLRFPAVEVGANVDGRDLDDAALAPVWDAAAALGVAVFVHPQAPVAGQPRVAKQNLTQVIGFPLETALAMSRIVFGGVLDRWPRLRWCFAHGGGAFAYILPRLDHGWSLMDEAHAAIPKPPSEYARRVWVDSLTLSPRVLTFALETFGPERVVVGSDYPFRLGTDDPLAGLRPLALAAGVRGRITRDNAREFLNLK
ncbi:MAG: amidohydrolase family protein [Candidatus Rokubacteria bacterium]|nr:amidohydrolase family protein [Candidatus Rokubacteria bacterium]